MIERGTAERILVVEDDESLLRLLERVLRNAGYSEVRGVSDARQVLPIFREWRPELVVADVQMPHLDGIAVMQQLRARLPAGEFLPVLLVTGDVAAETKQRALAAGASDFLTKPFDASEVVLRIGTLLALRRAQRELREAVQRVTEQVEQAHVDAVRRLTMAVKYRNVQGATDPTLVGELSAHIAGALDLPADEVERIRLAAPLHDLGMVGIPEEVLGREGSLSLDELDQIREHTSMGARILTNSESRLIQLAEEIALYHHEAWDGSGYTPGLAGDSIPLAARIVAVADTFCAMTRNRPYQTAHSVDDAVAWIESQAGSRFDPEIVRAFLRVAGMGDLALLRRT
ncbi:MAG: HD domain-containing phosphohydrolase [Gemmatimonadota bacterium]